MSSGEQSFERDTITTPLGMARKLVTYIVDPSTVRVRVREHFDRAPSIPEIAELRRLHQAQEGRRRKQAAAREPKPTDALNYTRPPKPPKHVLALRPRYRAILPADVIAAVAEAFGITADEVKGGSRKARFVLARRVACEVLRRRGNSPTAIGRQLGYRDHSTVIHALKKFNYCATPEMRALADALMAVDE